MKNQMGGQQPGECKCGMWQGKMCGMGGCCFRHGGWFRVVRLVIRIVIVMIVFCFGMMVGQLKGELSCGLGYRMMRGYNNGYGSVYPMMQNGQGGASLRVLPTAPSANQ